MFNIKKTILTTHLVLGHVTYRTDNRQVTFLLQSYKRINYIVVFFYKDIRLAPFSFNHCFSC